MQSLYTNRGQFEALGKAARSSNGWFSAITGEWYWYAGRWYRIGYGPKAE